MRKVDVFLSRKSADASFAKKIYNYLTAQGLSVFDSDHTLKVIGNSDYTKIIDEALYTTTHMIVVGSSVDNVNSSWVEAEWRAFLNRKRSGKTSGNLITVITNTFKLQDVPPSLAHYEVIPYNKKNFPIIYNYVRQENAPAKPAPKKPLDPKKQNKYLLVSISILLVIILVTFIYLKLQPYDATFFIKPNPALKLPTEYPSFKGGELTLYINNREDKEQILENGEVDFKQLPASSKGEKVPVKLNADNWKLTSDSIVLAKVLTLNIIPDGSLGIITGNIKTLSGEIIEGVNITIDNDTTITANKIGIFNIKLPYKFQKSNYILRFAKKDYQPLEEYYYPKSGNIDVRMKSK